jgi:hypothetical protein
MVENKAEYHMPQHGHADVGSCVPSLPSDGGVSGSAEDGGKGPPNVGYRTSVSWQTLRHRNA